MISVIIPIYNVEKFVAGCLTSVRNQTYRDIEVICVDDGSTDNSGKIADSFSESDSRFRIIHQKNGGLSAARNTGIRAANGDFVFFLDSDDYLHPRALEILMTAQIATNADVVGSLMCKTMEVFEAQSFPEIPESLQPEVFDNPLSAFMTRRDIATGVCLRLYRRSLLDAVGFIEGIYFEDVPFTTAIMARIQKFVQVPAKVYYYYCGSTSIMRSSFTLQKVQSYETVIRTVADDIRKNKLDAWNQVQRIILNGRFKIMVNQAVRKQKDPQERQTLFSAMVPIVQRLYQDGLISYSGMKPKHRLCLWLLCHGHPKSACAAIRFLP